MPELPWVKWYPSDWSSEPSLSLCDAASRGIWADAVNAMLLQNADQIGGTTEQLCRLCRCRPTQMEVAICEFRQFNVCEVIEQNGNITLTSRRLARALHISKVRREAGVTSANKRLNKTSASSASAYASASSNQNNGDTSPPSDIPSVEVVVASEVLTAGARLAERFLTAYKVNPATSCHYPHLFTVRANCTKLLAMDFTEAQVDDVCRWIESGKGEYTPNSPLTASDPGKFPQWLKMADDCYHKLHNKKARR